MAKKGQAVQLQIEVANDEEWDKLLQKDGLIIVDVYSEWCGPCLGMQANLKKIKLEVGGDILLLAVAKSDGITSLERFRNKSEPTWMFVSKRKMINLMFGADAPKLTRLILDELKKEQSEQAGQPTDRVPLDITEMAEEEKVRFEAAESKEKESRAKEDTKKAKELLERRTKECANIVTNLPNYGAALIFPSAKDKYREVLGEILDEAGLDIHQTEKVQLNEDIIKEMCYFTDISKEFTEESLEELYNDESLMILFKESARAEIEDIDDTILNMIYGAVKKPPGTKDSVAQKLITEEEQDQEAPTDEKDKVKKETGHVGIWVPPEASVRATALRMFFPKISSEFAIPEPAPEPEHLTIIFPLNKKDEALQVMHQYPDEIMQHGLFTSENCEDTTLVARNFKQLDQLVPSERTYSEKLVLQVSKKRSECIFAFAQLEPLYMSPNSKEGKIECEKFFPEDYNAGVAEEEGEDEKQQPEDSADKPEVQGEGEEQDEYEDNQPTEEIGEAEESADSPDTEKPEGEESDVNEPIETADEKLIPETNETIQTSDAVPTEPVTEEPVKLTDDILEELLYFGDIEFSAKTLDDLGGNRLTFALLFKRTNANLAGNIDDIVLQMVYGNSRRPPGDCKSPACKLQKVWKSTGKPIDWVEVADNLSEEELSQIEDNVLLGIWAPPNSLSRAMLLKLLFPVLSNPFKLPEQEEIPLHVAVAFDAFKAKDVFEISDKYPGKVMSVGYFSSDIPGKAKLLGKTTEQFEARPASLTYEEKIVIQLAKDNAQCFMEFMDLGPSYISTDIEVGAADCFYFFPPGYNTPESEIITYLKKKSKRKGKMGRYKIAVDQIQDTDTQSIVTGTEADTSFMDLVGDQIDEDNGDEIEIADDLHNDEGDSGEENEDKDSRLAIQINDGVMENVDKSTSPVSN